MQNPAVITDSQLREITMHGTKELPIQYYLDDTQNYYHHQINAHWHQEIEFVMVKSGTVEFVVGEKPVLLSQGDGIFINTRMIHGYQAQERAIVPNIVLNPGFISDKNYMIYQKFVEPILFSQISHLYLSPKVDWQKEFLQILEEIFHIFLMNEETKEIDLQIAICQLWKKLVLHQESCAKAPHTERFLVIQERLRTMMEFIYQSYRKKLCLSEIAAAAHVSPNEALRCFREGIGTSPIEYVIQYRLNKAKELLLTTEKTVTEISFLVGFETVGYFDRLFKKVFGTTPKAFRKHNNRK